MDEILKQLMGQFAGSNADQIGRQVGAENTQVQNVMQGALPILMSALAKNASSKQGANSLLNALDKDHDGSILDNLGDLMQNPSNGPGNGILKHVLGNQRQGVEQFLGAQNGLDANTTSKILEIAAPILLGYLGKQKKQQNMNPLSFLDMLKGTQQETVKQSSLQSTLIEQLLGGGGGNSNAGGGVMPMVFNMLKKFGRK